ncbi:MAG: hypothetical protein WCT49_03205 [Candidatus Paceibacterota bacterium]|nr:hypothetical protein [Candidatus Paceibacterota bacterium]
MQFDIGIAATADIGIAAQIAAAVLALAVAGIGIAVIGTAAVVVAVVVDKYFAVAAEEWIRRPDAPFAPYSLTR